MACTIHFHRRLFCLCLLSAMPFALSANEEMLVANFDDAMLWGEEEQLFSATRYIKRLNEAPAIATVITEEQIRNSGANNILDVLKTVPGIKTSINSPYGVGTIEVRGIRTMHSEKVLIMIDGHPLVDPFTGGGTWFVEDMFLDNVSRIEIIRGPGSALFGENAFVAVINIVTTTEQFENHNEISAGVGYRDERRGTVQFRHDIDELKISGFAHIHKQSRSGIMLEQAADIPVGGPLDDWKDAVDTAIHLGYKDFTFSARYVDKDRGGYAGLINVLSDESRSNDRYLFTKAQYRNNISEDATVIGKVFYDWYKQRKEWEILPEGLAPPYPDGMIGKPSSTFEKIGAEVQFDTALNASNNLTSGILVERVKQFNVKHVTNFDPTQNITGTTLPVPLGSIQNISDWGNWSKKAHRDILAAYAQNLWRATDNVEATAGIRFDHYSDFGNAWSPRAGLVWFYSKDTTFKFLYGKAFRAPNFLELYNTNNPSLNGNEALEAEKIATYEISANLRLQQDTDLTVTVFHNELDDMIGLIDGKHFNKGGITTSGLETELRWRIRSQLHGYVNHTFQISDDEETGEPLPGTAKNKGNVGITAFVNPHLVIYNNVHFMGRQYRDINDIRERMKAYAVLDSNFLFKEIKPGLDFNVRIANVFDKEYYHLMATETYTADYPAPGRAVFAGVNYKFN